MSTHGFGPPPPSTLDVRPTADDVEFFQAHGFLVVERLTTDDELAWLNDVFDHLVATVDRVFEPGRERDADGPARISQLIAPEIEVPELLATTYRRNAMHFAAALLQVDERDLTTWGHMILKPARSSRVAPWHQDEAYWHPELDYRALAAWLPLHDVTVDQGAMQFIPGSHRFDLLPHEHSGDPAGNLLAALGVDDTDAQPCPLSAGGATFHHHRTLHFTAGNSTERPRKAFPMEFQLPPVRRRRARAMPWVEEFRRATGAPPSPPTYIADGHIVTVP